MNSQHNLTKRIIARKTTIALSVALLLLSHCGRSQLLDEVSAESPLKGKSVDAPVYALQKNFHEVYELYKDSVVYISTERTVKMAPNPFFDDPFFNPFFFDRKGGRSRTQKQTGLGTGFILSNDGYICTNHHVVANMDKVKVKVGEKEFTAKIIGSDEHTDIALIKIEDSNNFKPVYFGDSDQVKVGDWAIAIGNPFGLDKTFTVGVISAAVRHDEIGNAHIQTDASINPGNSGGPLINLDGEVVGVNRMIYSKSGGNMGIGFAIPINTAKNVLDQLKKYKKVKRGYIGVQIAPLTEDFAKMLGLKNNKGALIGSVLPDTPADEAGLKEKDVILKINEKEIESFQDLLNAIGQTATGKTVKMEVWRNKKKINLWVTIKERP